jgi:hypothetical protein
MRSNIRFVENVQILLFVLGFTGAATLHATEARAQTRTSGLTGLVCSDGTAAGNATCGNFGSSVGTSCGTTGSTCQPAPMTVVLPTSPPSNVLFETGVSTETGAFLNQSTTNPTTISQSLDFSAALPTSTTSPLLLAALFEEMGDCEGPVSFPKVGNGGSSTHNYGSLGTVTDNFSVTNAGQGSDPTGYAISHSFSGSLNLGGVPSLPPGWVYERVVCVNLGHSTAAGTVSIVQAPGAGMTGTPQTVMSGQITATYSTDTAAIPAEIPCCLKAVFVGWQPGTLGGGSYVSSGSVTRSYTAPMVPALSPSGLAALVLLMLPAGLLAIRHAKRRGAASA